MKSRRTPGEKSEEATVPMGRKPNDGQDNITCSEGRVSALTTLSEEVSVGACRKANHTQRQNTRTPAQAILGGQKELTASSGLILCGGRGKKYAKNALLPKRKMRIKALKAARRRLSESRMRENLTSGSRRQGMETRIR